MEWSKSKTYLIIAFVITNVILLVSIYFNNYYINDNFDKKSLINLSKLLSNKNITYNVSLNIQTRKMSPIELQYSTIKDKNTKKLTSKYINVLKIIDDVYIELNLKSDISSNDYDRMFEYCRKFIKENFDEKKYKLKETYKEDKTAMFCYEELYDNMFIEQGYIKFIFSGDSDVDISIVKTKNINKVGKPIDTISNSEAVSKVISQMKPGDEIENIEIGYSRPQGWQDIDTRQIRLIPFWRIELKDGNFLYTEAVKN
ncbi:MAG: hypothetical protein ACTTKD_07040 [Peptoanaerobacter stomatis]|uniref:hypothetical protein n=1 Tax=Peptoanaerobacter stomatis TaxID=796937 RepID=UPI003F9F0984